MTTCARLCEGLAHSSNFLLCVPVLNSQTARFLSLFFLGLSVGTLWSWYHPVRTGQGLQLGFSLLWGPVFLCAPVALTGPFQFCGVPPEGTLGPARVFVLLQAGSGCYGGPGTLSPP